MAVGVNAAAVLGGEEGPEAGEEVRGGEAERLGGRGRCGERHDREEEDEDPARQARHAVLLFREALRGGPRGRVGAPGE
jgi:hypothetical protein